MPIEAIIYCLPTLFELSFFQNISKLYPLKRIIIIKMDKMFPGKYLSVMVAKNNIKKSPSPQKNRRYSIST